MKKTLKGFCISFALSSFAIWVVNEVFSSVVPASQPEIEIPQKNIALFFQKSDFSPQPLETKRVAVARLSTLNPPKDEGLSEQEIAELTADITYPIQIASVEDVADIPLEHVAAKQPAEIVYQDTEPETKDVEIASKSPLPPISTERPRVDEPPAEEIIKIADTSPDTRSALISLPADTAEDVSDTDVIPIENSSMGMTAEKVEVVDKAPQSQVAMASKQISVDTISIEVNDTVEAPQEREWKEMSEIDDNPWVVAKSKSFAKNNKAMEDFAGDGKETEIEQILAPQKIEQEGKEVQTAEMVKNILIPIPEDILNDENLTPQLVSPKKSPVERVGYHGDVEDDDEDKDKESATTGKKGFFKSLSSIFGGGSDDDEEEEDVSETTSSKKKKSKMSIGSLISGKETTKILPAEMRLSFRPGRAEISGQTLRWVQAFANKVAEDPNIILEIRIDKNSSYALQQRRLDLLHTVLDRRGIDESKINTVFTSREPNSFIIRTLRINDEKQNKMIKNNPQQKTNYQTW